MKFQQKKKTPPADTSPISQNQRSIKKPWKIVSHISYISYVPG